MPIDTTNKSLVAAQGDKLVVMIPSLMGYSYDDAMNLAAYLVAMGKGIRGDQPEFEEYLKAVESV